MLVSIIIPAYKKEETIQEDVLNIYNAMKQTRWEFEIIVVADGFLDRTFEEARKLDLKDVFVVGYEHNRGKGYAVRYGMARASGDLIAFIDAGMEINPNGISMVLEHAQWYDADIIVGSKRHPASKVKYPLMRKIYSRVYFVVAKLLFGLKVTDTQAGLKVFRREVLEVVLPRLLVKEFAFDIELLAVANYLGFSRIYDAPIDISLDFTSDSKIKKGQPFFLSPFVRGMLIDTLAVYYRIKILKYYDDKSERKWIYNKELDMNINTGEMVGRPLASRFTPVPDSGKSTKDPRFSIIIPVRSINEFMKENITHLKRLNYSDFEVLIILDEDEEYDFGGDTGFKLYSVGPLGPGEKRNIGAKHSTGDVLAFLDDDAHPSADWLSNASEIFKDLSVFALGAPAVTPPGAGTLEKGSGRVLESKLTSFSSVYRHIPKKHRLIYDYPTVNLFVRKDAFDKVGGFTTEFWPGEDTKLCLDLVNQFGRRFNYHPAPIVYHHRRNLFIPHLKQVSRYGKHRGQFARIFPDTSRLISYSIPSLFVLGLFFGLIFAVILPIMWIPYLFVLFVYIFLLIYESLRVVLIDRSLIGGLLVGIGILLTHIVYGTNFIIGFLIRPQLKLKKYNPETGDYIEG